MRRKCLVRVLLFSRLGVASFGVCLFTGVVGRIYEKTTSALIEASSTLVVLDFECSVKEVMGVCKYF